MRERLLIVANDSVEYKLLFSYGVLDTFLERFDLRLVTPVSCDPEFQAYVRAQHGLECETEWCRPGFVNKSLYATKIFVHFGRNSRFSESARQKLLLSLGAPLERIIRGTVRGERQALGLLRIVCNALYELVRRIPYLRKLRARGAYRHILFCRPDSASHIALMARYGGRDTHVYTLCRNFDTPSLKGPYVVPSNVTFCFDAALADDVRAHQDPRDYGELRVVDLFARVSPPPEMTAPRRVLFATTQPHFAPDQPKIVEELYDVCRRLGYELGVRLHPNDSIDHYRALPCFGDLSIESTRPSSYKRATGEAQGFTSPVDSMERTMSLAGIVATTCSTIVYEAARFGRKSFFINWQGAYDRLFARDHIQTLARMGIPILKSSADFEKLLASDERSHG